MEFGIDLRKPISSLPSLGQSLPIYSLCHLGEVASRRYNLSTHTGQRLSEEGCDLWMRQLNALSFVC